MQTQEKTSGADFFIFRARARRVARYGKYSGLPAVVLHAHADGKKLVAIGDQRLTAYADELIALAKPIHGSPQNYRFDNDGALR